jgi:polyhydroxybutyrate depolymerase
LPISRPIPEFLDSFCVPVPWIRASWLHIHRHETPWGLPGYNLRCWTLHGLQGNSSMIALLMFATVLVGQDTSLGSGDHRRTLKIGEQTRAFWVHIPPKYDAKKPIPVVLALHGAAMNGKMMEAFSGLSKKADEANFLVVYPNGTGPGDLLLTWNAGGFPLAAVKNRSDDVAFLGMILDELPKLANIDTKRIYVTGMSNGGMMSYRVAAELADRIAAFAPVAGTQAFEKLSPSRPVPLLHIHGTKDTLVPYEGYRNGTKGVVRILSVEESVKAWVKANGCNTEPKISEVPMTKDKLKVIRKEYVEGKGGAEVVLYVVEGGGHTWPGMPLQPAFLGENTMNISANDLMWEFFQRHVLK